MKIPKQKVISILFILGMILAEGYRGYVFLVMIAYGFYNQREYMQSWWLAIKSSWEYEGKKNGNKRK